MNDTHVFHITLPIFAESYISEEAFKKLFLSNYNLSEELYDQVKFLEFQLEHSNEKAIFYLLDDSLQRISEPKEHDWKFIIGSINNDKWLGIYPLATLNLVEN